MRIKDLFESPYMDSLYRDEARKMTNEVVQEVRRHGLSRFDYGVWNGDNAFVKTFGGARYAIVETDKWKDGEGGFDKNSKTMMLFVDDVGDIQNTISQYMRTIFHETIHYIDSFRFRMMPNIKKQKKGKPDTYYNSSVEMNAFFQDAMMTIEDMAKKHGEPLTSQWQDFGMFSRSVQYIFASGAFTSLTQENKQRMIRRLYKHWKEKGEYR